MNSENAKRIPLAEILRKMDFKPILQAKGELLYPSPLDHLGFIKIDIKNNMWAYSQSQNWQDNISLVREHLNAHGENASESDALRWIEIMMGYSSRIEPVSLSKVSDPEYLLVVKKKMGIKRPGLKFYLAHMGIPLDVAEDQIRQYKLYNRETKKYSYMLGLPNESEGLYLHTPFFTGCIGTFDISFIRGAVPKPDCVHVFMNIFDYWAAIIRHNDGQPFTDDVIILHCLSILSMATPYIKGYGYGTLYSWMDNTAPGRAATRSIENFSRTEDALIHKPMNKIYTPYENVKAWHYAQLVT